MCKLDNLVLNLGIQVAENLESLLAIRSASSVSRWCPARPLMPDKEALQSVPEDEIEAAVDAASDALAGADLSDDALFAADATPDGLAEHVHDRSPTEPGSGGSKFRDEVYEAALKQVCRYLVRLSSMGPLRAPRPRRELTRSTNQRERDQLAHHWFHAPECGDRSLRAEVALGSATGSPIRGEQGSARPRAGLMCRTEDSSRLPGYDWALVGH